MMKRIVLLITMMLMLCGVTVRAADNPSFSCAYSAGSGSTFYIDISCSGGVSASVFTLTYDGALAEYRGVEAEKKTSTVRDNPTSGKVAVCIVDSGSLRDRICRLKFKSLAAGTARFTLHIDQAADSDAQLLSGFHDDSVTVELLKSGTSSSGSSAKGSSSRSSRSSSSRSQKDRISGEDEDDDEDEDIQIRNSRSGVFDTNPYRFWRYILIGAAAVLLCVVLVVLGIKIGKKSYLIKKDDKDHPEPPLPPPSEDLTPEEKQAIIDELNEEIKP